MAKLVSLFAVPHDPTLPIAARLERDGKAEPGALPALRNFERLRDRLASAAPDVLVMVGSDHLNQWFMNNMPPFMVGKASRLTGPFDSEKHAWGLASCDVPIDGAAARHILKHGYGQGIDFAFSDEFTADHSFTIPLNFLRPEGDLPVVPVFVNLLAPPVPPGWRYRQVGAAIRAAIEDFLGAGRFAMIVTGHMSNSVGGPGMLRVAEEPESPWDRMMWELIVRNDVDEITRRSTWEQLYRHGNGTPGFLAYVLAFGAARGAKPSHADLVATGAQPACAFLDWDEARLQGGDG